MIKGIGQVSIVSIASMLLELKQNAFPYHSAVPDRISVLFRLWFSY